jgi:ABC-2 type transport system ATP-binding protein
MTNAILATGLSKQYGKTPALENCSLAVPAGRIVALVGPNGAGKTTFLHLAIGLLRPSGGSIAVLGRTPSDGHTHNIGFVAQDAPLYSDFTARDHITIASKLNETFDDDHARGRLASLDIPLDRRTEALSGGQRAQIALTLALAKRPELLLLDEPLANLDPLARRGFLQGLMEAAAEHGMTIVLSSHLIADMERVCDYLVVLHDGRVQVLGDVDELLGNHKVLIGPAQTTPRIAGVHTIINSSERGRQGTLLVRTNGPILDSAWDVHDVSLEDVLLAYLADPNQSALTGPEA